MELSVTEYLQALREMHWQSPKVFVFKDSLTRNWLTEQGSLSLLLEKHCNDLTVELLQSDMKSPTDLALSESEHLPNEDYLLRKVILKGDQQPWVLGRTLIPQSSMIGETHNLADQGEIPLGFTVFKSTKVRRDSLQVGETVVAGKLLLARRSRLWVDERPILVAELFLPNAPIYAQGNQA
ncbi:chorismate lyase [Vibrio astriarenae]|jgi:chorismate--pyruvate lyase